MDGVVLEQIRERAGIGEIVHRHEIDVIFSLEGGPHDVASDSPETIHSNLDRHDEKASSFRGVSISG